jgi:hypothetical protein
MPVDFRCAGARLLLYQDVKKRRDHNAVDDVPRDGNVGKEEKEGPLLRAVQITTSGVGVLSIHVDRFEMALEGCTFHDERSVNTILCLAPS